MIDALDRHDFDKEDPEPFSCPVSACNFYCAKAGQWAQYGRGCRGVTETFR